MIFWDFGSGYLSGMVLVLNLRYVASLFCTTIMENKLSNLEFVIQFLFKIFKLIF